MRDHTRKRQRIQHNVEDSLLSARFKPGASLRTFMVNFCSMDRLVCAASSASSMVRRSACSSEKPMAVSCVASCSVSNCSAPFSPHNVFLVPNGASLSSSQFCRLNSHCRFRARFENSAQRLHRTAYGHTRLQMRRRQRRQRRGQNRLAARGGGGCGGGGGMSGGCGRVGGGGSGGGGG
jgi:hypothetical protein